MFPGLMERVVAPVVVQLRALVPPSVMALGLAVNEPIAGRLGCVTVTVAVAVAVPVLLVAVSVYIVVEVGFRVIDPLPEFDENGPGETLTLVAPDVAQLKVILVPAVIASGVAEKDEITGAGTWWVVG